MMYLLENLKAWLKSFIIRGYIELNDLEVIRQIIKGWMCMKLVGLLLINEPMFKVGGMNIYISNLNYRNYSI